MLLELLENLRRTFLMFGWTVSKYTMILQIQHQRPYVIFVFFVDTSTIFSWHQNSQNLWFSHQHTIIHIFWQKAENFDTGSTGSAKDKSQVCQRHQNQVHDNGHLDTPKAIWMASHWWSCKEISLAGKLKPFTHKPAHFLLLSTTNKQTNKQQTCSLVFLLLSTTNEQTTNLLTSVGIIINNKPAHCRCATITIHHHGTKVSSPKCCFRPWWEVLFAKRSIVKEGRQGDPLKNIRFLICLKIWQRPAARSLQILDVREALVNWNPDKHPACQLDSLDSCLIVILVGPFELWPFPPTKENRKSYKRQLQGCG